MYTYRPYVCIHTHDFFITYRVYIYIKLYIFIYWLLVSWRCFFLWLLETFVYFCAVLRLNDFNHKLSSKMTLEADIWGRVLMSNTRGEVDKGRMERNLWKSKKDHMKMVKFLSVSMLGFEGGCEVFCFFLFSRFSTRPYCCEVIYSNYTCYYPFLIVCRSR